MGRSNFEHEHSYSSDGMRRTDFSEKTKTNAYDIKNAFDAWNVNDTIFYHNNDKNESLLEIINRRVAELPQHKDFYLLNPEHNSWMKKFIESIQTIVDIQPEKQPVKEIKGKNNTNLVESFLKEFAQDGWIFNGDYEYPEFSNSMFRGSKSFEYFSDTKWYRDNFNADA